MKNWILLAVLAGATAVLAATIRIDQPPPGLDAGVQVQAQAPKQPATPDKSMEENRRQLRARVRALVEQVNKESHQNWVITQVLFASQNAGADQDAAMVTFSDGKETHGLVYVFGSKGWQLFPDFFK